MSQANGEAFKRVIEAYNRHDVGWASPRLAGALSESPFGCIAELRNGKAIRIQTYLDPSDALEHLGRVS
jgi:hypothetical protein